MKISATYYVIILLILFSGCKKFVTIDPPRTSQIPEAVFSTSETANSALLTIYATMSAGGYSSPYWIAQLTGLAGDELINNSSFSTDIYENAIVPRNSSNAFTFWNSAYNNIYSANLIFEGCENSKTLPANVKKQLMAEAVFIRAYWNFYLVNLFGDIPIILESDYTKSAVAKRESVANVYVQIVKDLQYAHANLNENYVGPDGITPSEERVRPNQATSDAFLARVYLYLKNYPEAERMATAVIEKSAQYSIEPIESAFLKQSKEAIWQIMPMNGNGFNTDEGFQFILTTNPAVAERSNISDQLLAAFDVGDLRKSQWIGTYVDNDVTPAKPYYFPYKYKIETGGDFTEYSIIFRLSEMYLIRAEARAQQNNLAGAIADIDVIRDRAGIPLVAVKAPSINQENLLNLILKERQTELFAEQGHRWLDLKRTGNVNSVMTIVTPLKGGGPWSDSKQLWPIPQTDIQNNPNLTQNSGYN